MRKLNAALIITAAVLFFTYSCSKGGGGGAPAPNDPCAGVTVMLTATVTNTSSAAAADGSIAATATGGSGFTYRLNSGAFQASGTFTNLAAGTYTITAKNANGCTGSQQFTVVAGNACAGITININTTTATAIPCQAANGSITAAATGSTGFTYSLNGGAFQASGTFNGLAAGAYNITAKDVNGCTGNVNVNIAAATRGPLFTAVRTLLDANCISCHNNSQSEGGMNWTVDCNVITSQARIKARAVDNNPSPMPPTGPLSQADKNKITNWINAGGRYTD
ncbi:MAG: hypothetical protein ABW019_01695 [Chitinophagaceae bacterium]